MRTPIAVSLCLLLLLATAAADDKPVARPKPLTPEQAADSVLEAFKAKDEAALNALSVKDNPDPWLVADELCHRGEHDAAEALARAAPRKAVEKLPAYVASLRNQEAQEEARRALAALRTAVQRDPKSALGVGKDVDAPLTSVVGVQLAFWRAMALDRLRRRTDAAPAFRRVAAAAAKLGWWRRAADSHLKAASCAWYDADWPASSAALERALEVLEALGDRSGAARVLGNLGVIHEARGEYPSALSFQERALKLKEELGDRRGASLTLGNLGQIHSRLGDHAVASRCYERALALGKELGDKQRIATALACLGIAHDHLGDFPEALRYQERALASMQELGDRAGMAMTFANIGKIYQSLGDYPRALRSQQRSLALAEEIGSKVRVAHALANIGVAHARLGDYPKSLGFLERALAILEQVGDRAAAAQVMVNIGEVYEVLGDHDKALHLMQRALSLHEALGVRPRIVSTLIGIGAVHASLDDHARALAIQERALALAEEIGDRAGAARALVNIALVHDYRGDYDEAIRFGERALALQRELGIRGVMAVTLGNLGWAMVSSGDVRGGKAKLERAVREARRLRARRTLARHLGSLALLRLEQGEAARALMGAQQALSEVEALLGGLGEEEGATARGQFTRLFAVGTLAAARLEEPVEALTFIESGRAGALLEALGGRRAMRWSDLPEELHALESNVRAAASRARREYERALKDGDLRAARKKVRALDEAVERTREVHTRIQREAKRQAGLFYPRAATLEEVQGWLEKDQALVLYALCLDEALALVLTHGSERIVSLGAAVDIENACAAACLDEESADATDALARLRKLLVDPLELGDDVKTVLVSPEGPLCYVPFGALFDVPVAVTPSGTTHVLLLDEEREMGTGILALGAPDYAGTAKGGQTVYFRGQALSPLPATRAEVQAIGSVHLLGADANEKAFAAAVGGKKRWRAVHLACHGLVDPERPTLSSLAMTRGGEGDGFLTALEVLRMEIPADLAVLSACETAKGKNVKGEGIVGLTRAFMYAGAPRVLCSLWKVDDQATRALMVKFYELWAPRAEPEDPTALSERSEPKGSEPKGSEPKGSAGKGGLGAAAALRKAQEFVRGHEAWKHPYYWAAWVLWGLPN